MNTVSRSTVGIRMARTMPARLRICQSSAVMTTDKSRSPWPKWDIQHPNRQYLRVYPLRSCSNRFKANKCLPPSSPPHHLCTGTVKPPSPPSTARIDRSVDFRVKDKIRLHGSTQEKEKKLIVKVTHTLTSRAVRDRMPPRSPIMSGVYVHVPL